MKTISKILPFLILVTFASCDFNSKYVYLIDRKPAPIGQSNRLVLNPWRGDYGMVSSADNHDPNGMKFKLDKERFITKNGSKKWIVANWGEPDLIQKEGEVTFYTYAKKSKSAPLYDRQFMFGERPVKLGFRGDRLVEIQAYFSDRGFKNSKGTVFL